MKNGEGAVCFMQHPGLISTPGDLGRTETVIRVFHSQASLIIYQLVYLVSGRGLPLFEKDYYTRNSSSSAFSLSNSQTQTCGHEIHS
jgi:hypothetical protein